MDIPVYGCFCYFCYPAGFTFIEEAGYTVSGQKFGIRPNLQYPAK